MPRKAHTPPLHFPFHCIRRITSPEDAADGREIYAGQAPASSFMSLEEDENVREYLLEVEGRKKNRKTYVHRELFDTLENNPQVFGVLNGGITIVARAVDVDDKKKLARLTKASIINGSQTRGVLRDYLDEKDSIGEDPYPVHVTFEFIITKDENLIAQTSISRNFQNQVMPISIVGRLGLLDDLKSRFESETKTGLRLRTKETDVSGKFVETEKLLQVITALIPADLWPMSNERSSPNKNFTYSAKAKCLRLFRQVNEAAHEGKNPDSRKGKLSTSKQAEFQRLYQFYLDIASDAWDLYQYWKKYPIPRIRKEGAVVRKDGKVEDVNDGIVFPILAALSVFVAHDGQRWVICQPDGFSEKELADQAATAFMKIANSHPWDMGKSSACYMFLYNVTALYRRLSEQYSQASKGGA